MPVGMVVFILFYFILFYVILFSRLLHPPCPKDGQHHPSTLSSMVQAEGGPRDGQHPPAHPAGRWGGLACIQGTVKYFTTKQNYSKD